jgi:hypothetical protein
VERVEVVEEEMELVQVQLLQEEQTQEEEEEALHLLLRDLQETHLHQVEVE